MNNSTQSSSESPSYNYWAFISYSHQDNLATRGDASGDHIQWANCLHEQLETFRVPDGYRGRPSATGEPMPERFFPAFRDEAELPTSHDLGGQIHDALRRSRFLIVIASPRSADSRYVNEEVRYFRQLGRGKRILTLIVDGEPNVRLRPKAGWNASDDCFCPALVHPLRDDDHVDESALLPEEPIAADVRVKDVEPPREMRASERGQAERQGLLDLMKLKLIAGLMGVGLDELVQRDARRRYEEARHKAKRLRIVVTIVSFLALLAITGGVVAWLQRNEAELQRSNAVQQKNAAETERDQKAKALEQVRRQNYFTSIALSDLKVKGGLPEDAEEILWSTPPELRSWEWGWILHCARNESASLGLGNETFGMLSFSADGRYLLVAPSPLATMMRSATNDDQFAVFDIATLKELFRFSGRARFAPDGKHLIAYTRAEQILHGRTVRILEFPSGRLLAEFPDVVDHQDFPNEEEFVSPDGKYFVCILTNGTMKVWSLSDLRLTASWSQVASSSYAFSPRGNYILVVDEQSATVRRLEDGLVILRISSSYWNTSAFAFAPDDSKLIVPRSTNTLAMYQLPQATMLMELREHTNRIEAIAWSANGELLASVAREDGTFIWDAKRGTVLRKIDSKGYSLCFSPDSKLIGTVDHLPYYNPQFSPLHIRGWHTDSGILAFSLRDVPMWDANPPFAPHWQNPERDPRLAYSLDGREFWFSASYSDFSIPVRSVDTGLPVHQLAGSFQCVAFRPGSDQIATLTRKGDLKIFDLGSTEERTTIHTSIGAIDSALVIPNGKRIFTTATMNARGRPQTGQLWNTVDARMPLAEFAIRYWVNLKTQLSFSDDGSILVVVDRDGQIHAIDTVTGKPRAFISNGATDFESVCISPDGTLVAGGRATGEVVMFSAMDGRAVGAYREHESAVTAVSFSPRGGFLVSESDKAVLVKHVQSNRTILRAVPLKSRNTPPIAFSQDEKLLICAQLPQEASIHHLVSGESRLVNDGSQSDICSLAIRQDGEAVATTRINGSTTVFNVNTGKPAMHLKTDTDWESTVHFLPRSPRLVVTTSKGVLIADTDTQKVIQKYDSNGETVNRIAISPNGDRVIVPGALGGPVCRDLETTREVLGLGGHSGSITCSSFSTDGNQLVTGDSEGYVMVWNAYDSKATLETIQDVKTRQFVARERGGK